MAASGGSRHRALYPLSSPRRRGPITIIGHGLKRLPEILLREHGVWVPACAGTTAKAVRGN